MKAENIYEKPKVAIYCRLSDEDHNKKDPLEDSRSIQTQKTMLIEYAVNQDWDIYDIYSDDDYSGADENRPEYNRLLDDAGNGKFQIVLCKHQSRFTRDMVHVEKYINDKFNEWGVRYVSLLDGADTNIAGNKKSRQINGLVNEWYLEDLSENIRAAYITRKKQGKYLASHAVYGYIKDPNDKYRLIIDESAACVVRYIFDMAIKGYSLNKIAQTLNQEGVLPPTRYKTEVQGINFPGTNNLRKKTMFQGESLWQSSSVNRILKNETYTGGLYQYRQRTVSYKNHTRIKLPREQWIISQNTHEPIVSRKKFEDAQAALKQKPRIKSSGESHLFTGKLICCKCGSSMCFASRKKEYIYYSCSRRRNLGKDVCVGVNVSEKKLKEAVLGELKPILNQWISENEKKVIEQEVKIEESSNLGIYENCLNEKKAEIEKLITAKRKLYMDLAEGLITKDAYQELWEYFQNRHTRLTEEVSALEVKIDNTKKEELSKVERRKKLKELVREKTEFYLQCKDCNREILETFVDYIEVANGESSKEKIFKIHWKF